MNFKNSFTRTIIFRNFIFKDFRLGDFGLLVSQHSNFNMCAAEASTSSPAF